MSFVSSCRWMYLNFVLLPPNLVPSLLCDEFDRSDRTPSPVIQICMGDDIANFKGQNVSILDLNGLGLRRWYSPDNISHLVCQSTTSTRIYGIPIRTSYSGRRAFLWRRFRANHNTLRSISILVVCGIWFDRIPWPRLKREWLDLRGRCGVFRVARQSRDWYPLTPDLLGWVWGLRCNRLNLALCNREF